MSQKTETYEYCREMLRAFLLSEEKIMKNDLDKLYGTGSWHVNFFEFNLNQLTYKEVQQEVEKLTNRGGTAQVQYNTALARVESLYLNLVLATGEEFIKELEEDCIVALMNMNDPDRNKRKNVYKMFKRLISAHPVMIVAALGSADFRLKHAEYFQSTRGSGSPMSSITGVVP